MRRPPLPRLRNADAPALAHGARPRRPLVVMALGAFLAGSACGGANRDQIDITPSPLSTRSLSSLPVAPSAPPSGKLLAEMRQSSIDASVGRMQVWVTNDTRRDAVPSSIEYRDARLPTPLRVDGTRLRTVPAGSERGFPLVLPGRLDCARPVTTDPAAEGSGRLLVRVGGGVRHLDVSDETDVVGRFARLRCAEQRLARAASLRWADEVPPDRPGQGSEGVLTLVVRPTGRPGHVLRIDTVAGSHLLSSAAEGSVWEPGVVVRSDGEPTRIPLPLKPARCDEHGFVEGGGATAFRVRFHLGGEPGEVVLRMGEAGRRAAFAFARESCGLS